MIKVYRTFMAVVLFFIFFLSGCATIASFKITHEREWIEGKPFPVTISFTYNEKVESCTLFYTINRGKVYAIPLTLFGSEYGYVIPGEQLAEGELHYYFVASGKGKEYTSTTYKVTILNFKQATEKYRSELLNRVIFNPPDAVPYFDDAVLSVLVNKSKPDTEVILHYKKKEEVSYKEKTLSNTGGIFHGIISNEEINEGYRDYFFTISEKHPDVGLLTVTLPQAAENAPYSLSILNKDEISSIMQQELTKSISFESPETVPETIDLTLTLKIIYPDRSYIKKYQRKRKKVIIYYGVQGFMNTFVPVEMMRKNDTFSFTIKKEELEKGFNAFYFDIRDNIDHIGMINTIYPVNGRNEPFAYRITTKEELVAEKKADILSRISHISPETVDGITDLVLKLNFSEITEETEVELFYKQSDGKRFRHSEMKKIGNSFQGVITVQELQADYNQYYFLITVQDNIAGSVNMEHPSQGKRNYYTFYIEDSEDVYRRLKNNLEERITFIPVVEVARGESLVLNTQIDSPVDGTEVLIHYRRNRDKRYNTKYMEKKGGTFSGIIPEYDLSKKFDRYYVEVREPHDFFNYISVSFPHAGLRKPYRVKIVSGGTDEEIPDENSDDVQEETASYPEFSFTPLTNVKHNKAVHVEIESNMTYKGMEVYFKYRIAGKSLKYTNIKMQQNGRIFYTEIPPSAIRPQDQIEYYFTIILTDEDILYTVPDEDEIPFSVRVNKDKDK